ncbi:MAG: helix-turn-helix transcriptional regulator [Helicobacteraceae bacterium]|jgi:transcriptional regulator with XRE-family HTH domain|nr:helix-turn-helix transcriptional regulator [Helicobacteraceae bacterium]
MGDKADQTKNEVKRICADLGITQKELAELIGAGEATVSDWAREITKVPATITKLFDLLRMEQEHIRLKSLISETIAISTKK